MVCQNQKYLIIIERASRKRGEVLSSKLDLFGGIIYTCKIAGKIKELKKEALEIPRQQILY